MKQAIMIVAGIVIISVVMIFTISYFWPEEKKGKESSFSFLIDDTLKMATIEGVRSLDVRYIAPDNWAVHIIMDNNFSVWGEGKTQRQALAEAIAKVIWAKKYGKGEQGGKESK